MRRISRKVNNDYAIVNNEQVYRLINNGHWLMLSPRYKGVNRYMSINDMNDMLSLKKAKYTFKVRALEMINKQFREFSDTWFYNGNEYKVNAISFYDVISRDYDDIPLKKHTITVPYGDRFFDEEYLICSYQGKIYWAHYNSFHDLYPCIALYEFISLNAYPNNFVIRTNIKNIKPIFIKNEENRWEML